MIVLDSAPEHREGKRVRSRRGGDLKVGYDNDGGDDVTLNFGSGSFAPTYDHPGNLTKDFDHEFVYDAWNNLVKVRSAFDADVTVATYAFFADDRRASRTVTNRGGLNGVTYYFYDGHEVIEERDGSGAVVQQYLFGPQHIDELLLTLGENGANWVHQDANWNIIGTTTSTGQVAERYTYDPYGRLRARRLTGFGDTDADGLVGTKDIADWEATQGEGGVYDRKLDANLDGVNDAYDAAAFDKMVSLPGGRLTVPNRRFSPSEQWAGYTARTLDPESGLMHYRARAYSPDLRRFGQRDPIEYAGGGPNLYGYVDGNPWRYVDPFGESPIYTAGPAVSAGLRQACLSLLSTIENLKGDIAKRELELSVDLLELPWKKPGFANKYSIIGHKIILAEQRAKLQKANEKYNDLKCDERLSKKEKADLRAEIAAKWAAKMAKVRSDAKEKERQSKWQRRKLDNTPFLDPLPIPVGGSVVNRPLPSPRVGSAPVLSPRTVFIPHLAPARGGRGGILCLLFGFGSGLPACDRCGSVECTEESLDWGSFHTCPGTDPFNDLSPEWDD